MFAFVFPPLVMLILAGVFGTHATVGFGWQNPEHYYVAASLGVPVIALALVGLPVTLASYRERGVLRRLEAFGVTPAKLIGAQATVTGGLIVIGAVAVLAVAAPTYGIPHIAHPVQVLVGLTAGTITLILIGIAVGLAVPSARSAQAIGLLAFFPLYLLGGGGPPKGAMTGVDARDQQRAAVRNPSDRRPMARPVRPRHPARRVRASGRRRRLPRSAGSPAAPPHEVGPDRGQASAEQLCCGGDDLRVRYVAHVFADVPAMTEGIVELAVPIAPEHVLHGLSNVGSCSHGSRERSLGVGHLEAKDHGCAAQRGRRQHPHLGELVSDVQGAVADSQLDGHQTPVGRRNAGDLLCFEGFLVKRGRPVGALNDDMGIDFHTHTLPARPKPWSLAARGVG